VDGDGQEQADQAAQGAPPHTEGGGQVGNHHQRHDDPEGAIAAQTTKPGGTIGVHHVIIIAQGQGRGEGASFLSREMRSME